MHCAVAGRGRPVSSCDPFIETNSKTDEDRTYYDFVPLTKVVLVFWAYYVLVGLLLEV